MNVKAISLWNPWAYLVAMGEKTFKTRMYSRSHRGDLLICSSQLSYKCRPTFEEITRYLTDPEAYRLAYASNRSTLMSPVPFLEGWGQEDMLFGYALAIVNMRECVGLSEGEIESERWRRMACFPNPENCHGWLLDGRWGWRFENIRPLVKPFPVKGSQGFWVQELPENTELVGQKGASIWNATTGKYRARKKKDLDWLSRFNA